jgi:hypothetical protein
MNKIFFTFLLSIFSLIAFAQDQKDVIFPVRGMPIKNCIIFDVGPANMISYSIRWDTTSVAAKAYIKEGDFYDVFFNEGSLKEEYIKKSNFVKDATLDYAENRDYYYHENLYKKYWKNNFKAIPFLAGGLAVFSGGVAWYNYEKKYLSYDNIPNNYAPAYLFMFIGGASILTGNIIIGINSYFALEHKKEMKKIKAKEISLNLGIQQNGVGLSLKF